jgi:hypothetical protein
VPEGERQERRAVRDKESGFHDLERVGSGVDYSGEDGLEGRGIGRCDALE